MYRFEVPSATELSEGKYDEDFGSVKAGLSSFKPIEALLLLLEAAATSKQGGRDSKIVRFFGSSSYLLN